MPLELEKYNECPYHTVENETIVYYSFRQFWQWTDRQTTYGCIAC